MSEGLPKINQEELLSNYEKKQMRWVLSATGIEVKSNISRLYI